jgi:hypothetical protein
MRSSVFVMPGKHVIVKALLALILGPIAISGAFMLTNPDGDHFVGKMRDSLRVDRTFDQLDTLVKTIRQFVLKHPASASSNLMSELTQRQILPGRMISMNQKGLVVLSPWNTEISTTNESGAFGITVLMSQFGCLKALASVFSASGVSVNGQRLKLPINKDSAVKHCRDVPIPEVTFWYALDAEGKP